MLKRGWSILFEEEMAYPGERVGDEGRNKEAGWLLEGEGGGGKGHR